MSEQENVSLVQQIYSDFKTGNIEALLAKIDPNIIWELPEIQNVPFAGKRNGREAVADFFKVVNVSQEALRCDAWVTLHRVIELCHWGLTNGAYSTPVELSQRILRTSSLFRTEP